MLTALHHECEFNMAMAKTCTVSVKFPTCDIIFFSKSEEVMVQLRKQAEVDT